MCVKDAGHSHPVNASTRRRHPRGGGLSPERWVGCHDHTLWERLSCNLQEIKDEAFIRNRLYGKAAVKAENDPDGHIRQGRGGEGRFVSH